jgi:kynureninase
MRAFDPALDSNDPGWRSLFCIPADTSTSAYAEVAYFAGNSLGLQPKATVAAVNEELQRWAEMGVEGQLNGPRPWKDYHEALRDPAARLVGGLPNETVVMNSLTVNLHLLMATFYRPSGRRSKILMEDIVFPSDGYAVDSQVQWHGLVPDDEVIRLRPRPGEDTLRTDDVLAVIAENADELQLVFFSAMNYLTGELMDISSITTASHHVGAVVGWDLAHAIGNVELHLHDWDVDFAAWCSYKYVNSGPGAAAGAFIHQRHATDTKMGRLAGWWGTRTETRFRMERHFDPPPTADAWQVSNPPILSMTPVEVSLRIFDEVGMPAIRQRSERLNQYMRECLAEIATSLPAGAIHMVTPVNATNHGCQISLRFTADINVISHRLRDDYGVIADSRNPDIIRFAAVGLYTSYEDCWRAAAGLQEILT